MNDIFKKIARNTTVRKGVFTVFGASVFLAPAGCTVVHETDPNLRVNPPSNPISDVLRKTKHDMFDRSLNDPCSYWVETLTGERHCREPRSPQEDYSSTETRYKYNWDTGRYELEGYKIETPKDRIHYPGGWHPYPTDRTIIDYRDNPREPRRSRPSENRWERNRQIITPHPHPYSYPTPY